jgi:hypothetical protein
MRPTRLIGTGQLSVLQADVPANPSLALFPSLSATSMENP